MEEAKEKMTQRQGTGGKTSAETTHPSEVDEISYQGNEKKTRKKNRREQ